MFNFSAFAQDRDSVPPKDLIDVLRKPFKLKPDTAQTKNKPAAILPTIGYNPSFGFQAGAKISTQRYYGDSANTKLSVFGFVAVITSKRIINTQVLHNVFSPQNKMNWQGHWQLSLFGLTDYGLGPGPGYPDSADVIKFGLFRAFEVAYFRLGSRSYLGGGFHFVFRINIEDANQSATYNSPNYIYSAANGFNPQTNFANGILLAYQYINREHPIQSYGGIYSDIYLQLNQKWMGSSKDALQVVYDFRKYWSLSKRNPAHVLAIWNLASLKLAGTLPYFELPNTTSDPYTRSGRGYTISRFKGPSYFYFETEYRFPITANKLISGVCFINTQTTSNSDNKTMFKYWGSAAGVGLRILYQKKQRTTIAIDYGKGQYGASGIYIGLNEAF